MRFSAFVRAGVRAALAAILFSACTGGSSVTPTSSPPAGRSVIAQRVYQLWPPTVVAAKSSLFEVNTGWNGATLVFPMETLSGSCRSKVELWLFAVNGGRGQGPIGVYASRLFDLLAGPDRFPRGKTLLSARPRSVRSLDGLMKGWVAWDITSVYRAWVPGQPFGDSGLAPPVGGPFVLEMRSVANPDPV